MHSRTQGLAIDTRTYTCTYPKYCNNFLYATPHKKKLNENFIFKAFKCRTRNDIDFNLQEKKNTFFPSLRFRNDMFAIFASMCSISMRSGVNSIAPHR